MQIELGRAGGEHIKYQNQKKSSLTGYPGYSRMSIPLKQNNENCFSEVNYLGSNFCKILYRIAAITDYHARNHARNIWKSFHVLYFSVEFTNAFKRWNKRLSNLPLLDRKTGENSWYIFRIRRFTSEGRCLIWQIWWICTEIQYVMKV